MKQRTFFDEGLRLIPVAMGEKFPPLWKGWQMRSLGPVELAHHTKLKHNIALVCGAPTRRWDGRRLMILDYDARPPIKENLGFLRRLDTRINFSPRGFHVLFWAKKEDDLEWIKKLILGTFRMKPDTVRGAGGANYILIHPSQVNSHRYFWLDDGRQGIREI